MTYTSESRPLEGHFKEPSPVIGWDHHFSCLRGYQLCMVDFGGAFHHSNEVIQAVDPRLSEALLQQPNSPKAQSGANLVWPTIRKEIVMDL